MLLTQSKNTYEGKRYRILEWEGKSVRVFDSAFTALRINELLVDAEVDAITKQEILVQMIFCNPEGVCSQVVDLAGLLSFAVWEVSGIDLDGSHATEGEPDIIDWVNDDMYIEVSLWQAYGQSFEDIRESITLKQLGAMIGCLPNETPMGQAIYYRTAEEPKATKYNEDQIKHFRKQKKFWSIDKKSTAGKSANDQMTDAFVALARKR